MCDPVTIGVASLAISTATAGIGFMQQSQQASVRDKAIKANYSQQMDTFKVQQAQVNKQATDEMSVRAREAMIETARLRVLGGESGLAGGSNDRIENESQFNLGTDIASIESNRRNSLNQLHQEGKAIRASGQGQINTIKRPSLIGTGLQIAGAAIDAKTTHTYLSGKLKA